MSGFIPELVNDYFTGLIVNCMSFFLQYDIVFCKKWQMNKPQK